MANQDRDADGDLLGEQDDLSEAEEFFVECRSELVELIAEFAESRQLAPDGVIDLLLDLTMFYAEFDYMEGAAKPSGAGLKLHLDRFRRDFDEVLRLHKRGAELTVKEFKEGLERAAEGPAPE